MVIAVDAVGGDFYPKNPVAGAIEALNENNQIKLILVGPEDLINKELDGKTYDQQRLSILHAPQIIGMDDSPSSAVKAKRDSSITLGINAHKKGECSAFVSAGNTGALLTASTLILGKLDGVMRPVIAASFPTIKGVRLLVDAGANLELKPELYLQSAKMSLIFAKEIMGISNPKVGLLNVGEEPEKGCEIHREAFRLLSELSGFTGNIEGKDVLSGKSDIFLTDGFTGNILLKFGESIPDALKFLLAETMKKQNIDETTQKIVYQIIGQTMHTFNYEHVGGIPFLGVDGISLVGHGGSSPAAIKNMIFNAAECVSHKVNEKIVTSLTN